MKLLDNFNSQIDHVLNSSLTFITFVVIKTQFGLDLSGYFGLVLSMSALIETIQGGLYERPSYLKQPIGYKKFRLNSTAIISMCAFTNFIIFFFIYSESYFGGTLFCIATVFLRNIKTYDYLNDDIKSASNRSIFIFVLSISYFIFIYFDYFDHTFNNFMIIVATIKLFFVLINKNKIFNLASVSPEKEAHDLKILFASLLILIKSRLPLWVLLPFGLGLVGIYEAFRTLVEIFLLPSRGILNVMVKEIDSNNIKRIFKTGIISGLVTATLLLISYNFITSLDIYNHPEIRNTESLISGTVLVMFFWITETNSMILQYNNQHNIEIFRRFFAIIIFVLSNILFQDFINYKIFIILISSIYVVENIPVLFKLVSKNR